MSTHTPNFDLEVPSPTTQFRDLGKELLAFGMDVDEVLSQFDYNGKDPNLVLSRVTALEARVANLERRTVLDVVAQRLSGLTWPGSGDGWTWTAEIPVLFPQGMFTAPPSVSTPSVWASGFLVFAMLTKAPTIGGFSMRIVKKTAVALDAVDFSYSASQQLV